VPAVKPILKSNKLLNVCYDIRGPVLEHAKRLEEEGHRIIKLNIGNLAPFGFDAPDEIIQDMILNLPGSSGYSDSKGVFAARKAIMHYTQQKGVHGVELDDIYIGNGASELIVMAHAGAAQRRRRSAAAGARLSAVDRGREPVGRHAGALHLRRVERLDARSRRYPRKDHAEHARARRHQPEQPDRRAVLGRTAART
jgi:hypothetical protein